jgi:hypothetical protein
VKPRIIWASEDHKSSANHFIANITMQKESANQDIHKRRTAEEQKSRHTLATATLQTNTSALTAKTLKPHPEKKFVALFSVPQSYLDTCHDCKVLNTCEMITTTSFVSIGMALTIWHFIFASWWQRLEAKTWNFE